MIAVFLVPAQKEPEPLFESGNSADMRISGCSTLKFPD